MTIAFNDILKVTVTMTVPGTTIMQNVYYAQYITGGQSTDAQVVGDCAAWVETIFDEMNTWISQDVDINEITVAKWVSGTPGAWLDIGSQGSTSVGLGTTEMIPNGVALVMRAATGVARTIGRKFFGGLTETAAIETTWDAGLLTDAAAALALWFLGPAGAGREYLGGVFSSVLVDFVQFTLEGAVSAIPGYQRRRKPGVGS